jgi:hypothetical protein
MLIWIGDAKVIKAKGRFCIFVCGGDEASKTRSIRDEISAVTDMWAGQAHVVGAHDRRRFILYSINRCKIFSRLLTTWIDVVVYSSLVVLPDSTTASPTLGLDSVGLLTAQHDTRKLPNHSS